MIPVSTPLLDGNELKYLQECIQTGWIFSEGPFVGRFETDFATYVNRNFGIAVANGSAALDIAVQALDIGPGDEVIMPTFTIISPVQSVVKQGAKPVLVDSHPLTWNMDVSQIEGKITSRTKAILVVHIYGLPVDMDPILALAAKYKLKVIEDAAEAHGQTYKGQKCGSFGDISTVSFYTNKLITTGEGGMILCDDPELADRCKRLRNLSFDPAGPRFVHQEIGWNYRMTNLQAALGVAQMERVEEFLQIKKRAGKQYQTGLYALQDKGFNLPLDRTDYAENTYWVFGLLAETQQQKDKTVKHLQKKNIGTRPFFWCMHEQPVFQKMNLFTGENYPVAERLARNGFYIPMGSGIKPEEIDVVITEIGESII